MSAINARALNEPQWPSGGFTTRKMDERNYTVNVWGYPVSSQPTGAWSAGSIRRMYQPVFQPPTIGLFAYDPTDPSTWHQSQH
jgi:hypothetical protein